MDFTNGYLITKEVVDMFGRCRINRVHIPLDALDKADPKAYVLALYDRIGKKDEVAEGESGEPD